MDDLVFLVVVVLCCMNFASNQAKEDSAKGVNPTHVCKVENGTDKKTINLHGHNYSVVYTSLGEMNVISDLSTEFVASNIKGTLSVDRTTMTANYQTPTDLYKGTCEKISK